MGVTSNYYNSITLITTYLYIREAKYVPIMIALNRFVVGNIVLFCTKKDALTPCFGAILTYRLSLGLVLKE